MNKPTKFTIDTHAKKLVGPYYGPHEIGETFNNVAGDLYLVVTAEQATAFERVVKHQGEANLKNILMFSFDDCIGLQFEHIFICIEPDGYAHS